MVKFDSKVKKRADLHDFRPYELRIRENFENFEIKHDKIILDE